MAMTSCPAHFLEDCGATGPVEANPDIAGIGTIISFLLTACLAIIASVIIIYLDHYQKIVNIFRHYVTKNPDVYAEDTNYIRGYKLQRHLFWADVVRKILNALNDSQLFTGTAVQIVSLIQHCTISIYHYQIVTELAYLSTVTHLLALVALRDDFVQDRLSNVPRVAVMILNLALLGYTSFYGYSYELSSLERKSSANLACYYAGHKPAYGPAFWFKWILLLAAGLAGHFSIFFSMYVTRHKTEDRSWIQLWGARFRNYVVTPVYTIYGLVNASIVLSRSQALGSPLVEIEGSEKEWGFGQLLAMLLLGLTLLPGWETYREEADIAELLAI
ncbi:uncharacterized protein BDR25DRAFT_105488 [Lindgomyces ingoldianus]|uniref:Uncharacterized protein n=1 Tax=Lindgomyces ingoldianus TaxID=673940 RepID=A0ACB6QA53_9PLEO|nr:uncharacterized protein BDR25DRAFT_105488 [Lindgomyces ingoldianus]KAF2463919.1 hypothetical protein BDR25DRAFT_105488 [Lindgomyces ingoldianus]